ncbi:MAG: hypothetical protein CMF96_12355 [Candidatus Marinimicrobia bacterium]|nr:hypothetical protein [Candidatus Neomarinimicrobiota bacterium]|tara:strand:- start:33 stop:1535 length:1503 start_codon:yes stop_codon:yes gene_type:complete
MFKIKIIIVILIGFIFPQSQLSGNANFSYANRINEGSILRLPYRMLELKYINQQDDFSLNSELAFEWNRKLDRDYLYDNSPQDFILDLRELYLTWYVPIGDLRIGKQIHSWGFVDENSPLDNLNGLDYYYLFDGGASRKLGSYSFASNIYWNNFSLKFIYSPFHNVSRMPIINGEIDPEFPEVIPIVPTKEETIEIENPSEYGFNLIYTIDNFDIGFSYFSGSDRIFNFSGVNVFGNGPDISFPYIDIYYGFRKTNVFGLSTLLLKNNFTIRSDIGFFLTKDINIISEKASFNPELNDSLHITYRGNEESKYIELNFQLEYTFSNELNFLSQIFYYKSLKYISDEFPDIPDIPNIPENINPELLFKPGMGSPLGVLTERAILFQFNKLSLNNQLRVYFNTLLDFTNKRNGTWDEGEIFNDQNNNGIWDENESFVDKIHNKLKINGKLITLGTEYNLSKNIVLLINLSKILGNDYYSSDANYQFNLMENFSNFRFDIKYNF